MNGLTKKKISDSGLKKSFIANSIGVTPSDFSKAYHGKKSLPPDKETALREFVKNKIV